MYCLPTGCRVYYDRGKWSTHVTWPWRLAVCMDDPKDISTPWHMVYIHGWWDHALCVDEPAAGWPHWPEQNWPSQGSIEHREIIDYMKMTITCQYHRYIGLVHRYKHSTMGMMNKKGREIGYLHWLTQVFELSYDTCNTYGSKTMCCMFVPEPNIWFYHCIAQHTCNSTYEDE